MKSTKKPKDSTFLSSLFSKYKRAIREVMIALIIVVLAIGLFRMWENYSNVHSTIQEYIDNGEIKILEVRYTPEKVMELYGADYLNDGERTFQKADLKFQPHVLFGVKFSSQDKKTKEGVLLWSLVDGEIVLDCEQWEKTHGFEDAINAQANRQDFKILQALEKVDGKMSIAQLQKDLQAEENAFYNWLESAKEKHLIVQQGNDVQLHFQNPRLFVVPQTRMAQCLVSKPYQHAQKISRRYSPEQLQKVSEAAFGQDFTIRSSEVIYLPIYSIEILNPDGSTRNVEFNAITGFPIIPNYLKN